MKQLPGPLHSVNPIGLFLMPHALWTNRRNVSIIQSQTLTIGIVEVGATLVGAIHQTASEGYVTKGEEKGYFYFGGNCLVTLLPKNQVHFSEDLIAQSAQGVELYARMGDCMGRMIETQTSNKL